MGYMCGRFAVTTDPALLAEKIQAIDESTASAGATKKDTNSGPNYNVAPTTSISAPSTCTVAWPECHTP